MRILIVKTSSLGDIIHAFSTLSFLRTKYPSAIIDWVVERPFEELVKAHPGVSNVLCIDSKSWRKGKALGKLWTFWRTLRNVRYDFVIDLQGNIKSGLVIFLARSSQKIGFGWKAAREPLNTFFTNQRFIPPAGQNISNDNLFLAQSFLKDFTSIKERPFLFKTTSAEQASLHALMSHPFLQSGLKIMVCPGSRWPNKKLTIEALGDFLQKIDKRWKCTFLFLWGTPEEKAEVDKLEARFPENTIVLNKMTLPMLQNLMSKLDLVIAMDSLPLHLAATTGVKTFSVFGASLASKFNPVGEEHMAVQGSCPYGRTFDKRCPVLRKCETGLCIRGLTGNFLFDQFETWWDKVKGA